MLNKICAIICSLCIGLMFASCNKTTSEPPQNSAPDIVESPSTESVPEPVPEQEVEKEPESTSEQKTTPEPDIEVNQVIGSFQTTILDQSESRVKNIKLASQIINGYVVQPGAEFSFNKVVGERSKEKSFEDAIVIIEGEKDYEPGGGICQVSSTLLNAAQKAGMEILERHSHEKDIHYLPLGQDAAIAYGSLDFRFKNIKEFPIKIAAYVEGDQMITSISRAE